MLRPPVRLTPPGPRAVRVLALLAALQLLVGLGVVGLVETRGESAPASAAARARVAPPLAEADARERAERVARRDAVQALLEVRSTALLARDRERFLSVVDPAATALRERQAALFDALAEVPLKTWQYVLGPSVGTPRDRQLDERYGAAQWWAPDVTLEYALEGFDDRPTVAEHHLTFVRRDGRWLLGADDDFAAVGLDTPRALWDRGPVVAERVGDVLVLGRPQVRRLLRDVATLTAAAVPRVNAVWGTDWRKGAVVLVPSSSQELAELLDSDSDYSQIAAVATAELAGGTGEFDPAGDRILVNPDTFRRLGQLGRRVVLTHELAHVATRRATGPAVPAWLAEGFADYIGYRDVELPLGLTARELRRDVRAGRVPTALPADSAFDGSNPQLAQAYEQSWLAVRLLARKHGDPALLRFYRAVGASRGVEAAEAVDAALRAELGTSTEELVRDWRASLQRDLG